MPTITINASITRLRYHETKAAEWQARYDEISDVLANLNARERFENCIDDTDLITLRNCKKLYEQLSALHRTQAKNLVAKMLN